MGDLYNPYPKLPKNIRQIGERDQSVRLYMEDYVNTYLKRLFPKGGQDLRAGVLLGMAEDHDGTPYLFVDGAMEMEDVTESGEQVVFSETAWKKTYQAIEQMFPKRIILGWFLCGVPGCTLSPLNYWKQHSQYFGGKNQLMYLNCGLEGEEAVYVANEDGFYRLRGYSVYYERNQMMQDYMILRKDVRRVESGAGETVIRDFRQRMEENKSQITARRGTIRVLGGLCGALTVMLLAGGVAMMGNYQRMKEMEAVIASVLPAGISEGDRIVSQNGEVVVEEAPSSLRLTTEAVYENETMSGDYPESAENGGSDGNPAAGSDGSGGEQAAGSGGSSGEQAAGSDGSGGEQAAGSGGSSGEQATGNGGSGGGQAAGNSGSGGGQAAGNSEAGEEHSGGQPGEGSYAQTEGAAVSRKVQAGQTIHEVQEGETLYGICLDVYGNGALLEEICRINGLEDENTIIAGQNLILP